MNTKMVRFTIEKIRESDPCYGPTRGIPEGWSGTALDVLCMKGMPPQDKLWIACREGILDTRLLRRFAIAQAKTCKKQVKNRDEFRRILNICTRFADGKVSEEELFEARNAAEKAAWDAACNVRSNAAEIVAWRAAESAASKEVGSAAWGAAENAALCAAERASWRAEERLVTKRAKKRCEKVAKKAAWKKAARLLRKMIAKEVVADISTNVRHPVHKISSTHELRTALVQSAQSIDSKFVGSGGKRV